MALDTRLELEVPPAHPEPFPAVAPAEGGLRRTVQQGILAMTDQVVVSGMRFFTTAIIGRTCGPEELGDYSLGFTLVMLIAAVQESLILIPYNIFCGRIRGAGRTGYAGALLVQCLALAALMVLGLASLAQVLPGLPKLSALVPVVWVLAGMLPFELLREFCRRVSLAHFRMGTAVVLDSVVATIQISGLVALALGGRLSSAAAFAVAGLSAAVPAMAWLVISRRGFSVRTVHWAGAMRRNWSFGKWVFAASMTSMLHLYSAYWLLAILLDPSAAGIYAACQTIVLLSNPFVLGMGNYLIRRTSHALDQGGNRELRRVVARATALIGASMAGFCVLVALAGDRLLLWIYGPLYVGQQTTVVVLACAALASAVGMGANHGLYAFERPDVDFKANLLALGVMLVVTASLVGSFRLLGVAGGLLAGNVAGTALRWTIFAHALATPIRVEVANP